jgi:hypothetical protein
LIDWNGVDPLEAVEFTTLEWLDWFNHRRLLEPIGNRPSAEAKRQARITPVSKARRRLLWSAIAGPSNRSPVQTSALA